MFNIGDKVKVIFNSTKHTEALVDGKRMVKYAIGTLRLKTNEDGTQSLAIDYDNDGKSNLYNLDQFVGIKKI